MATTRDDAIEIEVGAVRLAGTLITPSTKVPGVLFVHGWGGSQEQYRARAREIAGLGCASLIFDLRGHALTSGQYETVTRESNLQDVLAAYDVLVRTPMVDPDAIAVVGSSYGGYMAAILAARRPVKWLALRVPALYRDANWDKPKRELHKGTELEVYRRSVVPPDENQALRACADFRGDVLIVESEQDHIIPHTVITSYVEACAHAHSLTYRVLKGADHGLSDDACQRAYTNMLVGWLGEMWFGASAVTSSGQGATAVRSA